MHSMAGIIYSTTFGLAVLYYIKADPSINGSKLVQL